MKNNSRFSSFGRSGIFSDGLLSAVAGQFQGTGAQRCFTGTGGGRADGGQTGDRRTVEIVAGEMENAENMEADLRAEMPKVVLRLRSMDMELKVTLWQSTDGSCYVFLPGFAAGAESSLSLVSVEDNGYLQIGDRVLNPGDGVTGFSWEEAYPLRVYNNKNQVTLEAPLIFLHSSRLPVISMETDSGSMEKVEADKEEKERGSVSVWDENGGMLYEGKAESIGASGNSTFGLLKKPFEFKLRRERTSLASAKRW